MKCPKCGAPTEVLETRMRTDGRQYRRRQCLGDHRFATVEVLFGEITDRPPRPVPGGLIKLPWGATREEDTQEQ